MSYQSHNLIVEVPVLLLLLPHVYALFIGGFWQEVDRVKRLLALIGMLVLIVALLPVPFFLRYYPMSFHMLRHMLLLLIFPPVLLSVIPTSRFRKFSIRFGQIRRFLYMPVTAYIIGMGVMLLVNLPMLGPEKITHIPNHVLTELGGVVEITLPAWWGGAVLLQIMAGVIYSLPVFIPLPEFRLPGLQKILYLFLSCVGCSLIGLFITLRSVASEEGDLYRDIQTSGLIMWVPGCFVYIGKSLAVLYHFFRIGKLQEELPVFEKSES